MSSPTLSYVSAESVTTPGTHQTLNEPILLTLYSASTEGLQQHVLQP